MTHFRLVFTLIISAWLFCLFLSGCSPEQVIKRNERRILAEIEGQWEITSFVYESDQLSKQLPPDSLGTLTFGPIDIEEFIHPSTRQFPDGWSYNFSFAIFVNTDPDDMKMATYWGDAGFSSDEQREFAWLGSLEIVKLDLDSLVLYNDGFSPDQRGFDRMWIRAARKN
jgi:hypothetical protein